MDWINWFSASPAYHSIYTCLSCARWSTNTVHCLFVSIKYICCCLWSAVFLELPLQKEDWQVLWVSYMYVQYHPLAWPPLDLTTDDITSILAIHCTCRYFYKHTCIIGASLSEPHTSGTALHTCVCVYVFLLTCWQPYTVNFKWACLHLHITKFELMNSVGEGLLPECSVSYLELRRLKLKDTWHLTPCLLQIINGRLPTGSTNLDHDSGWGRFR